MRRWLAGALLVTTGWLASPAAVPVYDGVGQPDQPYRYVGKDPAPVAVSAAVEVSAGRSGRVQLLSAESGPQVILDLSARAFTATAPTFTVTATPLAADTAPARGQVDSNVYRISASDGAVLQPDDTQGFLFLRAAVMTRPAPVIAYRAGPGEPWTEQPTRVNGRDNVNTPFRKVGDYVVVRLPGAKDLDKSGGIGTTRLALLGGGILALLVVTVLVLRRSRGEQPD